MYRTDVSLVGGAIAVIVAASIARPARADESGAAPTQATQGVSDAALSEARAQVGVANTEYKLGHFAEALAAYERAYQLAPTPKLLFNIGQCHRMLGDRERAIFSFEGYLRELPAADNRAMVEELLAELRAQATLAQSSAAPPNAQPAPSPAPEAATKPAPEPRASSSTALRVAGIAGAAVGVVLVGAGVYAELRAKSKESQLDDLSARGGAWTPDQQAAYDDGKRYSAMGTGFLLAGGVLAAAGAVVIALTWPRHTGNAAIPTTAIRSAREGSLTWAF